jgi:hypothetical protein
MVPFYYLTTRLGLRTGEVYAITRRQLRREPPRLIVDQAVQRGTKTRQAKIVSPKNDEAYVLDLTEDVLAAVDWHVGAGYARPEFLFSRTSVFPRYIDSHVRPLKLVQRKLGLRLLSHHKVGRHSVASQAVTSGESVKAVQAQLGHRSAQSTHQYAHLGSGAQRRLVEALKPERAPHEARPQGPWQPGGNGRPRSWGSGFVSSTGLNEKPPGLSRGSASPEFSCAGRICSGLTSPLRTAASPCCPLSETHED